MPDEIVIPDKPAFKAAEVCELLKLQPYVLKSWEIEFKDLGVSKTPGGPRVYRRVDVERAVRIRELVLREGLTLAGVRRRLEQETAAGSAEDALIAELASAGAAPATPAVSDDDRRRVEDVKRGLRELLDTLSRPTTAAHDADTPAAVARPPHPPAPRATRKELTVEPDGEPSLFSEEPVAADVPAAKPSRRRKATIAPGQDD